MAGLIDMSNDRANVAYVGDKPWHGLGQQLQPDSDLATWRTEAGLDWTYKPVIVQYRDPVTEKMVDFDNRRVLARSDTGTAMSIVSGNKYKIVQPGEILEFYRDLIDAGGFEMHTAGSLKGGKVIWALAKIGDQARIMGQDTIDGFMLLASSCDGLMATRAMFTSVRVVCNNTLQLANAAQGGVRVPHSKVFDPAVIKTELGIGHALFQQFADRVEKYASTSISKKKAAEYIAKVISGLEKLPDDMEKLPNVKNVAKVIELFDGKALGSDLRSSKGTLWGAVNAITEYCDHHAGRTADSRLSSSWLGQNRLIKDRAVLLADQMIKAA